MVVCHGCMRGIMMWACNQVENPANKTVIESTRKK